MAPKTKSAPAEKRWAGSADEWRRRAGPHDLSCPSGMAVTVRLLGIGTLVRLEGLSDELNEAVLLHVANHDRGGLPAVIGEEMIAAARGDEAATERAVELTRRLGEMTKLLVCEALVEPKLSVDELDAIPEADLEFLMRVVTGRQPFDAAGRQIGVEPLDAWATFRDEHRCPAGCEACARVSRTLSTVHLDDV
jgi:hypothetical protein